MQYKAICNTKNIPFLAPIYITNDSNKPQCPSRSPLPLLGKFQESMKYRDTFTEK